MITAPSQRAARPIEPLWLEWLALGATALDLLLERTHGPHATAWWDPVDDSAIGGWRSDVP